MGKAAKSKPNISSMLVQNYISNNRPASDQLDWSSLQVLHREIGGGLVESFDANSSVANRLLTVGKNLGSPNPVFSTAFADLTIKTADLLEELASIEAKHSDETGQFKSGPVKSNDEFASALECYSLYSELRERMLAVSAPFMVELVDERLRLTELTDKLPDDPDPATDVNVITDAVIVEKPTQPQ